MADTIQIEIKFNPENYESPFSLPRRVEVERGARIEWIIKEPFVLEEILFSKRKFRRGLKFTIYFEESSAFEWKSESLLVIGYPPHLFVTFPIQVASGTAQNKGDHKYGLKLASMKDPQDTDPDYDDDPFITVY